MKKAAIYARYSSHNQREKSIDDQVSECRAFAIANDCQVVKIYADRAVSGTTDDRPEFQEMLRDADRGAFETVIMWKRDRFARNRYDAAINKRRLERNGVSLLYTAEPSLAGAEGVIIDSTLEGFAEYYSKNLSVNVCRGMKSEAEKAKYLGSFVPFGFKIDENKNFVRDDVAAPFVVSAFEMYAAGVRMSDISDYLYKNGFTNPKGKKFSIRNLSTMFENKKYIGTYEYRLKNGDFVSVPDGVPALISRDLWDKCQAQKRAYKKAPHACGDYALTGLMFCGACGQTFVGTNTISKGRRYQYYRHFSGNCVKNCLHRNFSRDALETAVFNVIYNDFLGEKNIKKIEDFAAAAAAKEKSGADMEKALRRKKAEVEKKIQNIMTAIENGIFTPTTKERLTELEDLKASIDFEIIKAAKPEKRATVNVGDFLRGIKAGAIDDPVWRKETANLLIKKITLYKDHFIIEFNLDGASPVRVEV